MRSKEAAIQDKTNSYLIPSLAASLAPLVLFIVMILTIRAQAQSNLLQLDGPVSSGGQGCPNESVNITFTPDMQAFTVLFDRMQSQPQPGSSDLKKCEIKLPVYLEPGYRLRIVQVDHRGFQSLQRGDRSEFASHLYWTGGDACNTRNCARSKPISLVKQYAGPIEEPLFETMRGDQKWEASPCGGKMQLEIETSVQVSSRDGGAFMQLDSLDASLSANSIYKLSYEKCSDVARRDPNDRRDPDVGNGGRGNGRRDPVVRPPPRRPPPPPPPPRRGGRR
ncbi:MAG: DUF4360 domain-containing protein [Bdellovibrionota bacterium]